MQITVMLAGIPPVWRIYRSVFLPKDKIYCILLFFLFLFFFFFFFFPIYTSVVNVLSIFDLLHERYSRTRTHKHIYICTHYYILNKHISVFRFFVCSNNYISERKVHQLFLFFFFFFLFFFSHIYTHEMYYIL